MIDYTHSLVDCILRMVFFGHIIRTYDLADLGHETFINQSLLSKYISWSFWIRILEFIIGYDHLHNKGSHSKPILFVFYHFHDMWIHYLLCPLLIVIFIGHDFDIIIAYHSLHQISLMLHKPVSISYATYFIIIILGKLWSFELLLCFLFPFIGIIKEVIISKIYLALPIIFWNFIGNHIGNWHS